MAHKFLPHLSHGIHAVVIGTLALSAWLFAKGTNNLMMMQLYEAEGVALPPGPSSVPSATSLPKVLKAVPDGHSILRRNIFSSKIGPILPHSKTMAEDTDSEPLPPDELPLVPCEQSGNQLLATIVSESSPDWSIADISANGEKSLYRTGDTVGDREIVNISWRHVFLKSDTDICYIDMFGEENLQNVRKYGRHPLRTKVSRRYRKDVKLEGNTRIISKKLAKKFAKKSGHYARQLRLRSYKKNSQVVGYRIRRLPSGNPLTAMGLKLGDVIHEVNGKPLNSVKDTLSAIESLKRQQRFSIAVTRRGKPGTVSVEVGPK